MNNVKGEERGSGSLGEIEESGRERNREIERGMKSKGRERTRKLFFKNSKGGLENATGSKKENRRVEDTKTAMESI